MRRLAAAGPRADPGRPRMQLLVDVRSGAPGRAAATADAPGMLPLAAALPVLIWAMYVAASLLAAWMAVRRALASCATSRCPARCLLAAWMAVRRALAARPEPAASGPGRGEWSLQHHAGCGRALQARGGAGGLGRATFPSSRCTCSPCRHDARIACTRNVTRRTRAPPAAAGSFRVAALPRTRSRRPCHNIPATS